MNGDGVARVFCRLLFDNVYYEFLLENWWTYDDYDPEHPFYFNRSWIMLLSDWASKIDIMYLFLILSIF